MWKKSKLIDPIDRGASEQVWNEVYENKAVFVNYPFIVDGTKSMKVRQGDRRICTVQLLPERIAGENNVGLVVQKGAPYVEDFNRM